MTMAEALAVLRGGDLEAHRARQLEYDEIAKEAEQYRLLAPAQWPSLEFNWDFRAEAQRFALDGCQPDSFAESYPLGLRLGWVSVEAFDSKLSLQNRRALGELWKVGEKNKLAMAIAYLRRGKPITPPLVLPLPAQKQICLEGGNHRYTVAKFSGQIELPIYVDPSKAEALGAIVTVRWT
jgi:hypothetical protein